MCEFEIEEKIINLPRDHENAVLSLKKPKSAAKHGLHPSWEHAWLKAID